MSQTLKGLDFDVHTYNDLKRSEIVSKLEEFSKFDHSKNDCILIAVLSHGDLGYLQASDYKYEVDLLWQPFTGDRSPTLVGKPKLFVIQACRGKKRAKGVEVPKQIVPDSASAHGYTIPECADFLIAYSTVPGYVSWRDITKGTQFIQTLCQELKDNGKNYEIMQLLRLVNRKVAIKFETKQSPCIMYMLTRSLKFNDK